MCTTVHLWLASGVGRPKKAPQKKPEDAGGQPLLTRSQAAQMLGSGVTTVRRLEKQGLLHPIVLDGVNYFARDAIARAAQARPNAVSGKAFTLFEAGKTPVQVVVELDADPEHIRTLWETYQRLQGCWVIQGPKSLRAWEGVYHLGELTPTKLLRCIEIVCADPKLRALLEAGTMRIPPPASP